MTCFFSKHDANINKNFGLFSIYIKKSYFFINIHRNKETNCTVASFFLLLIQIFYSCFRSKGIVNWKKNYIFADELKLGMMKRTTINVLLRVVLVTTMTFVMSIQTAGAQSKDPIEEGFLRDQKKALSKQTLKSPSLWVMKYICTSQSKVHPALHELILHLLLKLASRSKLLLTLRRSISLIRNQKEQSQTNFQCAIQLSMCNVQCTMYNVQCAMYN